MRWTPAIALVLCGALAACSEPARRFPAEGIVRGVDDIALILGDAETWARARIWSTFTHVVWKAASSEYFPFLLSAKATTTNQTEYRMEPQLCS